MAKGKSAAAIHLSNVLWHGFVVCAVYLLAFTIRPRILTAAAAAALFLLHPVHVESVAWITELKNTLSAVFYLSSMLVYLRFDRDRHSRQYWLALGLFVLALLTKTVTASLKSGVRRMQVFMVVPLAVSL